MKKKAAFILLAAGTIGASLAVAQTMPDAQGWESAWQIDTGLFVVSLMAIGIGARLNSSKSAVQGLGGASTLAGLRASLQALIASANELRENLDRLEAEGIYKALDKMVAGPVMDFTENRQALIDGKGMAGYAEVMVPFAQGERYLNRAWSASVDGYKNESVVYIKKAAPMFEEALSKMQA